jgi:hypothetical protein
MMARDFPEIGHEFDVWHFVKVWNDSVTKNLPYLTQNIAKSLYKKSKQAGGRRLEVWIKSIKNVLWAALESSGGNMQCILYIPNMHPKPKYAMHATLLTLFFARQRPDGSREDQERPQPRAEHPRVPGQRALQAVLPRGPGGAGRPSAVDQGRCFFLLTF